MTSQHLTSYAFCPCSLFPLSLVTLERFFSCTTDILNSIRISPPLVICSKQVELRESLSKIYISFFFLILLKVVLLLISSVFLMFIRSLGNIFDSLLIKLCLFPVTSHLSRLDIRNAGGLSLVIMPLFLVNLSRTVSPPPHSLSHKYSYLHLSPVLPPPPIPFLSFPLVVHLPSLFIIGFSL